MEKKDIVFDRNLMHNDAVQSFSEKLFSDIIGMEHLVSKKRAITYNENKAYGYFFEKKGKRYFLQDFPEGDDKSIIELLPIKVMDKLETDYKGSILFCYQI